MRTQTRRSWLLAGKWSVYLLLLLLANTLQTLPSLQLFGLKPLFILPLCLAVALLEGEFSGALFGAVGGLLWDLSAGRTVGLLGLSLLCLCFLISVLFQIFLRNTPLNYAILGSLAALVVLSMDYLYFYVMPGYSGALQRYLIHVLPLVPLCGLVCLLFRQVLVLVRKKLDPDERD